MVAIIAVLVAMLLPALNAAREHARNVVCKSNMRQMGVCLGLYLGENHGLMPPSWMPWNGDRHTNNFMALLAQYVNGGEARVDTYYLDGQAARMWMCPSFRKNPADPDHWEYQYQMSYHMSWRVDPPVAAWPTFPRVQSLQHDLITDPHDKIVIAEGYPWHVEFHTGTMDYVQNGCRHFGYGNDVMAGFNVDYDRPTADWTWIERHPNIMPY